MSEIYGVVGGYWASLVGVGRQELSWGRRAIGLGFSTVSMPAEFIPAVIALKGKMDERRRIGRFEREWNASRDALKDIPTAADMTEAAAS